MSNGKFKMKYGDSVSPGTFREDAPAQKFKKETTTTNKRPSWLGQKSQPGIPGGGDTRHSTPAPKPPRIGSTKPVYKQTGKGKGSVTQTGGTPRPSWIKPISEYAHPPGWKPPTRFAKEGERPSWMKKKKEK